MKRTLMGRQSISSDDTQARAVFLFRKSTSRSHQYTNPSSGSLRNRSRLCALSHHCLNRGLRNSSRSSRDASCFSSQTNAAAALSKWASSADRWFTTNKVNCNIDKTAMMYAAPNPSNLKTADLVIRLFFHRQNVDTLVSSSMRDITCGEFQEFGDLSTMD